jgi:hypothetical protein
LFFLKNLGPELEIEALIAECSDFVSSLAKGKDKGDSRNILEAICPAVNVQILQNLSITEEGHPKIAPQIKESYIPSRLDTAMEIALSMQQVTLNVISSKSEMRMKSFAQTISLQFDTLSKSNPSLSTEDTMFDCRVAGLDVDLKPSQIHVGWMDFMIVVGHQGPELVTATAIDLKHSLSQSLKTLRLIEHHREAVIQTVTYQIIHLSESLIIIDPLSTIQPSYLVQEGTPRILRTDSTFRFLFHLRNCLGHLRPEDRSNVFASQSDAESVNPDTFASTLHSRLVHLDQDLDAVYDLILLEQLLKIKRPKPTSPKSSKVPAVSVDLQNTCLRIRALTSPSTNEFFLTGIQVYTCIRPLDLVQHTFNHTASMSQTSLREKRPHLVERLSIRVVMDKIRFTVYSHLMDFVQQLLRVRRIYISQLASAPTKRRHLDDHVALLPNPKSSSSVYIDASLFLRSVKLQAAAANLIFEVGAKALQVVPLLSLSTGVGDKSLNTSLLFGQFYLKARSPSDKMRPGTDQDILAAFDFTSGKANVVMREEQILRRNVKVVFSVGGLHLSVPRSAIKLYRFVEEWRADFLPGVEQAFQAALSELRIPSDRIKSPTPSISPSSTRPLLQVNGQIMEMGISLQVMHGTWLSWQAYHVIAYVQSSPSISSLTPSINTFGLQIASSTVEISSKDNIQGAASESQVKLAFPALSLGGGHEGRSIQTLVIIDFLDLKVKPSHWDTLLVVQQKFGQDFNDLVTLMQETRLKSSSRLPRDGKSDSRLNFMGHLKMRGFRIGFEGFSSTMFLECQDIGGGLRSDNRTGWDVGLTDLALSLAPRNAGSMTESFSRGHRSVFVIIDVKLVADRQKKYPYGQTLELIITKTHAVMHPSSIGEIGDFVDHLQVRGFILCQCRC